jgi:hypothetical protein
MLLKLRNQEIFVHNELSVEKVHPTNYLMNMKG